MVCAQTRANCWGWLRVMFVFWDCERHTANKHLTEVNQNITVFAIQSGVRLKHINIYITPLLRLLHNIYTATLSIKWQLVWIYISSAFAVKK